MQHLFDTPASGGTILKMLQASSSEKLTTTELILSEQRKHARRFDEIVQQAMATIAILEQAASPNREMIAEFKGYVNRLFLPNVHDNIVSIDDSHAETDDIPLIVGRYPESYRMDESFLRLTGPQFNSLWTIYKTSNDQVALSSLRTMIRPEPSTFPLFGGEKQRGSASYRVWKMGTKEASLHFLCRPLMRLNTAHPSLTPASSPSVLFHEFIHTDQYRKTPTIDLDKFHEPNNRISRELEAHDKQYGFIQELVKTGDALYEDDSMCMNKIGLISKACDLNPPDDRYAVNENIIQHLKQHEIQVL